MIKVTDNEEYNLQFNERLSQYPWKGNGVKYVTKYMFLDQSPIEDEKALYSLQPWDRTKNGIYYPSIHRLYVDMGDLAEFEFANTFFGGYQHWLTVKSGTFFKEAYAAMVEELNAKVSSRSLQAMVNQMEEGTASQATLKYLADKDYKGKAPVGKPKRRQPPKKEGNVVQADFERITKGK